jgi:hypothetical protein
MPTSLTSGLRRRLLSWMLAADNEAVKPQRSRAAVLEDPPAAHRGGESVSPLAELCIRMSDLLRHQVAAQLESAGTNDLESVGVIGAQRWQSLSPFLFSEHPTRLTSHGGGGTHCPYLSFPLD